MGKTHRVAKGNLVRSSSLVLVEKLPRQANKMMLPDFAEKAVKLLPSHVLTQFDFSCYIFLFKKT